MSEITRYPSIYICEIIAGISDGKKIKIIDKEEGLIYDAASLSLEAFAKIYTSNDINRYECYYMEKVRA